MVEKRFILIAHDSMKKDMVEWAAFNKETLKDFKMYATEGTGREIIQTVGLDVAEEKSPLGSEPDGLKAAAEWTERCDRHV